MTIKVKPLRDQIAEICSEDDDFVGVGAAAYAKADRILSAIEEGGDAFAGQCSDPATSPGVTAGAVDPATIRAEALREAAERIALHIELMEASGAKWPVRTADKVAAILALIDDGPKTADSAIIRAEVLREARQLVGCWGGDEGPDAIATPDEPYVKGFLAAIFHAQAQIDALIDKEQDQ